MANHWLQKMIVTLGVLLMSGSVVPLRAQGPPAPSEKLTLAEAVALALEKNPSLRATSEERTIAKAQTAQARAAWFPRLDFVQGFTRGNNPVYVFGTLLNQRQFTAANFALPGLNAPTPLNNNQTRVEGRWLLWDSMVSMERVRGARKMETAADFSIEQARQDLVLRVVRAYYGVIVARENVAAARESLRAAESNEERVAVMEKAGLAVTSDLLSAQVFRAQMKEREIRAANQLALARMNLGNELGLGPDALREPAIELVAPGHPTGSIEDWERAALSGRPALRAAELMQQAARNGKKQALGALGPKVGSFANFERDAESLTSGPSGTNWTAGVRLEWNIFAGGADKARLDEAKARERQAAYQLEWMRSGIRLEARQAFLEVSAAEQRAAAARDAAAQASESLRILQDRYDAGLATMTDLLRAQSAQLDARTMQLAALHDAQVARAALERAAGKLTTDSILILGEGQ
jgi:outer membrane protein TolC